MNKTIACVYPEQVSWKIEMSDKTDAYQAFGKKSASKIKSALARLESTTYRFQLEPVTEAYIDGFLPLYEANIASKDHPQSFDIKDAILPKISEYLALSLYQDQHYLGGLIFHQYPDHLATAFKVYPRNLDIDLPINITFVAEYHLYHYAIEKKLSYISHGSGKNCFGLYTAIGLAMFKLQAGNRPRFSQKKDNQILRDFSWDGQQDVLIFEGESDYLTKAKLLLTGNNPIDRYSILLNHPQLQVETILWN